MRLYCKWRLSRLDAEAAAARTTNCTLGNINGHALAMMDVKVTLQVASKLASADRLSA